MYVLQVNNLHDFVIGIIVGAGFTGIVWCVCGIITLMIVQCIKWCQRPKLLEKEPTTLLKSSSTPSDLTPPPLYDNITYYSDPDYISPGDTRLFHTNKLGYLTDI